MRYTDFFKKIIFLHFLFIIIAGSISCDYISNVFATEKDWSKEPLNILFIGNSFTHYNDGVDVELGRLFASSIPQLKIHYDKVAVGGERLIGHFKKGDALVKINAYHWDKVILQEYSNYPISNKPDFYKYAKLFYESISECGAETIFFMTWAYEGNDEMTPLLASAYNSIGNELGCRVVPVGLAFSKMLKKYPEINLYADYKHPNKEGTYLIACCFYAFLTEQSPIGINYIGAIEPRIAKILQETAWEVVGKRLNSK